MDTLKRTRNQELEQTVSADEITAQYVDDIEVPEDLPEPDRTWVARVADIGFAMPPQRMQDSRKAKNLPIQPVFHVDWEPLSFRYDFNPAIFTDNPKNYQRDWVPFLDNDGKLMGPQASFGQMAAGFKALGYAITKNDIFRPQLLGKIFKVQNKVEEYPMKENGQVVLDENGKPKMRKAYTTIPVEELSAYNHIGELRTVKRGYEGGSSGIKTSEPTSEQVAALKAALHGKKPAEFTDAIFDSGDMTITCDPFIKEAADGTLLDRLTGYGGKVISGMVVFEEIG